MDAVLERLAASEPSQTLEHEGTVEAKEATYQNTFGDAGQRVRSLDGRQSPDYLRRLAKLARVLERAARTGETGQLREAMQTADFPLLFGDILDRQMVGRYQEYTPDWRRVAKTATVRDFRSVKRFATDGMEGALNSVGEQKVYPQAVLKESKHTLSVSKYGRTTGVSWEAMINDDNGAFAEIPDRFARAARRTEARAITALYVGTTGPLGTLYTSGNANIVTGNPPLDILGLQTAMTVLGNMRDVDSEPILVESMVLEVPPALAVVARNILNATQIYAGGYGQTGGGGAAAQGMLTNNWMRGVVELVVNPYIPILASSSNGSTTWFLHASVSSGRAPFEAGFLRGYELPQIFQKTSNQQRIGGASSQMDGDFDFDTIFYKVRHVFGCTSTADTGGAKLTVASNGSGS